HKEGVAAPLLFVDGNGILHPRRSGIATAVGVMAGVPTIGVGKKLLCGKVEQTGTSKTVCGLVLQDDELLGAAIRSSSTSRPIYVSPGNKVDVETAALFATSAFRGHRLPEPLFQADALSKRAARLARIASRI
ncbi:MAG: endonuclease V, partial [Planctomycetaceae bacterium]